MMGTAAVAIALASGIPESLVNLVMSGGGDRTSVTFGHAVWHLAAWAQKAKHEDGQVDSQKESMSAAQAF